MCGLELDKTGEEPLGRMEIRLGDPPVRDGSLVKTVKTTVNDSTSEILVPRHVPEAGWIEIFGLPPFSEWVGLSRFEDGSENVFHDPDSGLKERFSSNIRRMNGIKIELERSLDGVEESYSIREISTGNNSSIQLIESDHSHGEMDIRIEKTLGFERNDIHRIRDRDLGDIEKEYYRSVFREESIPDVLIFKDIELDGSTPPVLEKFFPFWDKTEFDNERASLLEMGYLDYGAERRDIDKVHGRWYKLLVMEEFDHPVLEIREGNWESTTAEFKGIEVETIQKYDKFLYSYSD